ncbi:MAG: translation elongation factor Ts [Saccharofermentans sp.]|nr:translation elongation factor Ts [Saccharofermentans sp.]
MAITAQQVKELRDLTGCGIMDCKKALIECDSDIEKAKDWLREKGMAKAEKKASRVAAEGVVASIISDDKKTGAIVEINIETDFAAATDKFKAFVETIKNQIMNVKPADIDALKASALYNDSSKTVELATKEAIADIGENTSVRRFSMFEVNGNGAITTYIHMGGKVGVLVEFTTGDDAVISTDAFQTFAKNIGMQIAASNPSWVAESEVPQEALDREVEIIKNKALEEGKPEQIIETRIVPGQIKNFYKLNVLLNQEYVKDEDKTIAQYIEATAKELGTEISVARFVRYGLGEGIEKKEEDFAEEVRKQAGL